MPASARGIDFAEGRILGRLVFSDSWCHRRVVTLRFVAQRRGHWTVNVDFTVRPDFLKVAALRTDSEVLVPLFTFSKDIMPRAQVGTADECGHGFPLLTTRSSRMVACMIMMWLAEEAGVWPTAVGKLGRLTDTDPRVSARAFDEVEQYLEDERDRLDWHPSPSAGLHRGSMRSNLIDFANAARLFNRSVILLTAFPRQVAESNARKIATFTYDAPIRLTRAGSEFFGLSPLRVAPLTIFGGDAESYHAQLEPPEGVVVVDARLLYSYTARWRLPASQELRKEDWREEDWRDQELLTRSPRDPHTEPRDGANHSPTDAPESARARPLPPELPDARWRRWWGFVLGSGEPMPAHVRVGGRRLPRLIDGRDVVTIFHVYPDMSAFAGLLVAAGANFTYVLGLFLALVHPGGFHTGLKDHPEPIFLLGVLVAGFGSGLALYKKEHLLTSQVARPWRWLFAIEVTMVAASLVALLMSIDRNVTSATRTVLWCAFVPATLAMFYLLLISWRAWVAQRAGIRIFSRQGLIFSWLGTVFPERWARFPRQGHVLRRKRFRKGRVPDILDPRSGHAAKAILDLKGQEWTRRKMERLAQLYLDESNRRDLFNQGVPPASRHDPSSRGSSGP